LARAQGNGLVDIEWIAPEGCPAASAVNAQIDELLGGPARERASEALSVRATVEHGSLWLVTIETKSATSSGHRSIEAATCPALANATALIVALMIDPEAVAAHTKKVSEDTAPRASAPPPPAAPPPPVARRTTFGFAGVGVAGNLGVLPAPDAGPMVLLGLERAHWRTELRVAYGLRKVASDPLAEPEGAYGKFGFFAATLAGCYTVSRSLLDLGPCAEVEAGLVRGEGVGADHTTSEDEPWLALGAGAILAVKPTRWLRFPVRAEALVPLWRPEFVFLNAGPIFRSQPLGARLTLAVEVQF
jgi:hypothetical protein